MRKEHGNLPSAAVTLHSPAAKSIASAISHHEKSDACFGKGVCSLGCLERLMHSERVNLVTADADSPKFGGRTGIRYGQKEH